MSSLGVSVAGRALVAFAVTAAAMPFVLAVLRRRRLLDVPNHRSSHQVPAPRGGGFGPALGCLVALAISPAVGGGPRLALVLGAGAFGTIGVVDDLRGSSALRRLIAQGGAATLALPWLLHGMRGSLEWRVVFGAGVIVWLMGYVNAFNFMDGINGLSAAQAIVAGGVWCAIGAWQGVPAVALSGAILAGTAAGFAPFNFPAARVFLGDVGSYFIGAWMAVTVVVALRAGLAPEVVVAPLAIYLADTATTIVRRLHRGDDWRDAHREHAYQRLCASGWSHTRTTTTTAVWMVMLSGLGAMAQAGGVGPRAVADVAAMGLVALYLRAPELVARSAANLATA